MEGRVVTEFKENDLVMTRVPMKGTNGHTVAGGSVGVVSVVGVGLDDGSTSGIEVLFEGDPGSGTYAVYNSTQLVHAHVDPMAPELPKIFIPESFTLTKENYAEVAHWCGPDTRISKPWTDRPRLLVKTGFSEDPNFRVTVEVGDKLEKTKDGKIQIWVHQDNVSWDEDPPSSRAARVEPESSHLQLNDYVQVNLPESVHHEKTGWIAYIDTIPHVRHPFLVKFKDENGACTFARGDLKLLGSMFQPEDRPAELKKFRTGNPLAAAIGLVNALYYDSKLSDGDVYIVWFCSTLQNWKALVSTNVKDNSYYELTHNGDKKETYVDRYVKVMNQHFRIPDEYLED